MATVSERIHGLRRPGASLLKKTLPARPSDKALSRKAVNPAANTTTTTTTTTSSDIPDPSTAVAAEEQKDLPSLPLPHVVPVALQVTRPPRGSSLNDGQTERPHERLNERVPERVPERAPERQPASNLLTPQPSHNARPVSEAPSISQFIPDPEPEPLDRRMSIPISPELIVDGQRTPGDSSSNNSTIHNFNSEWTPPLPDNVVVPPLTRVHYDCFHAHRHMPQSNNVWYATACMTCRKLDQEVRHRCTFCCLRVCVACFERLQRSKDRSLAECFP